MCIVRLIVQRIWKMAVGGLVLMFGETLLLGIAFSCQVFLQLADLCFNILSRAHWRARGENDSDFNGRPHFLSWVTTSYTATSHKPSRTTRCNQVKHRSRPLRPPAFSFCALWLSPHCFWSPAALTSSKHRNQSHTLREAERSSRKGSLADQSHSTDQRTLQTSREESRGTMRDSYPPSFSAKGPEHRRPFSFLAPLLLPLPLRTACPKLPEAMDSSVSATRTCYNMQTTTCDSVRPADIYDSIWQSLPVVLWTSVPRQLPGPGIAQRHTLSTCHCWISSPWTQIPPPFLPAQDVKMTHSNTCIHIFFTYVSIYM